jgi:hypothetical protein
MVSLVKPGVRVAEVGDDGLSDLAVLIPLAERSGRVMREALAALETLRATPSEAVERSRPIRVSVMLRPAAADPERAR